METSSADQAKVELCQRDFDLMLDRMVELRLDESSPAGVADQPGDVATAGEFSAGAPSAGCNSSSSTSVAVAASGADWVEFLVGQMSSAVSMDDARRRAAGVLEAFQGSVAARAVQDKELRLGRMNAILRKAVVVQHRRRLEDEARVKELQGEVERQREQIRLLEMNNYTLSLRLLMAHGDAGSMAGRFHPDIC